MSPVTFSQPIPEKQTVALVRELGGPLEFDHTFPVPAPGPTEVLVKVLYTGVCQSDLHTAAGTASSAEGTPITAITLPHIGGHEGIARVISLGSNHCVNATNHLHHEAGSFQQYCVLGARDCVVLPHGVDMRSAGPVLCAGVTAYKAVKNAYPKPNQHIVILGAGGGLGLFATQYSLLSSAFILCIDAPSKASILQDLGASFLSSKTPDLVTAVLAYTNGGAHAVIVTTGNPNVVAVAAQMLRVGGTLSLCGIPPGGALLGVPVAGVVIRGLKIVGNLVGSRREVQEALDLVVMGKVKSIVSVRKFEELPKIYEELKRGEVVGRVVLKIAEDEGLDGEVDEANKANKGWRKATGKARL